MLPLALSFDLRRRNVKSVVRMLVVAAGVSFASRSVRAADGVACPAREAVDSAVRALLSRSKTSVSALETKFRVDDEGDRYTVTALDRTRSYVDEARDCDKRADVAAVFIALTLAPPQIANPEREVAQPPPASPPNKPVQRAPDSKQPAGEAQGSFSLDLGARAGVAPRSSGSAAALGAELGFGYVREGWGGDAFVGYERSLGWELSGVPLREARVPFGVLLRRSLRGAALTSALELGPMFQVLRLSQDDASSERATFLEVGARVAGRLQLHGRVAPYAALCLDFFPFARDILVEPRGSIGTTSLLRIGASVGFSTNFP